MPALAALSQAGQPLAWIAPPYLPYAPGLAQGGVALERLLLVRRATIATALWAAEQAAALPGIGAVLPGRCAG